MRITRAPYFADIVKDTRSAMEVWHWIVQREGSPEILAWSHASTERHAIRAANQQIDVLTGKSRPATG